VCYRVPAGGAHAAPAGSGCKRAAHPAASAPAASRRACSVASRHSYVPFRCVAGSGDALPAEPPPASTATSSQASTPAPAEPAAEPAESPRPNGGIGARVAVSGAGGRVQRGCVTPPNGPGAQPPARRRIHVAWNRKTGAVPGCSSGHRPEPKRSCSITSRHCPDLLPGRCKITSSLAAMSRRCGSCSISSASVSRSPAATPPAATGHQERALTQSAVCKRRQHLLDVAAGLRDYLNPSRRNRHLHRPGYRPADQHVGARLGKALDPRPQIVQVECHVLPGTLDAAVELDDQHVARYVEHRADSPLPMRYGDLHPAEINNKLRASKRGGFNLLIGKKL